MVRRVIFVSNTFEIPTILDRPDEIHMPQARLAQLKNWYTLPQHVIPCGSVQVLEVVRMFHCEDVLGLSVSSSVGADCVFLSDL